MIIQPLCKKLVHKKIKSPIALKLHFNHDIYISPSNKPLGKIILKCVSNRFNRNVIEVSHLHYLPDLDKIMYHAFV